MKRYTYVIFLLISFTMLFGICFSCKEEVKIEDKDPVLQRIVGDYYQDLVRTPVNPDGTIDTANMAKIVFDKKIHNFGILNQGEKKEHVFEFKNEGSIDLIIIDVKTSCGCTVPSYSEEPIKPGEKGELKIAYDSTGKKGVQEKKVIVRTNSFPNQMELTIIADVIKK